MEEPKETQHCSNTEIILYKLQRLQDDFAEHEKSEESQREILAQHEAVNTAYRQKAEATMAFLKFINIVGILTGALLYLFRQGGIIM